MKRAYLLITILSTLFLSACSSDEDANKDSKPATIVHAEDVYIGDMPIYLHAVGSVKADRTVHIQSRTPGELLEILVKDGDIVSEGQVLFRIDKAPLEAALAGANASYQSNRAQLVKARDDLSRISQLSKSGFASDDQQEQAKMRVDMLNAALKADDANIKNARLNLSYADIKAPIDGKIGSINSDIGNYISPGQPILTTLEDTTSVKIDFAIPESELTALRASYNRGIVPVQATTGAGVVVEGVLTFLGNVNPATGTIQVTARFENNDNALWVGQFVDVLITTNILKDVKIVSEKAVTLGPNGLFVYVIDNNIAKLRLIESSVEEGGRRVVSAGLNGNEKIVVDGHVRLFDGAHVEIANNTQSPSQNTSNRANDNFINTNIQEITPIAEEKEIIDEPVAEINTPIEEATSPLMEIVAEPRPEPIAEPVAEVIAESVTEVIAEPVTEIAEPVQTPTYTAPQSFTSQGLESNDGVFRERIVEQNAELIQDLSPLMIEEGANSTTLPLDTLNSFEEFIKTEEGVEETPLESKSTTIFENIEEIQSAKLEEITVEENVIANSTSISSEVAKAINEKQNSITTPITGKIDLSTKTVFGGQSYFAPFPKAETTEK